MTKELVFDTKLYASPPPEVAVAQIESDLSGLVLEAGNKPLEERINFRRFVIKDRDILDPETGKSVFGSWAPKDGLGKKESAGAEIFYKYLLYGRNNSLVVNISPPGGISPYKESRFNIGYKPNYKEILFYGIPSKLSPEDCLLRAIRALEFSEINIEAFSPDELRDKAIPLHITPPHQNVWEFLKEIMPLDSDAWKAILDGLPEKMKEKAKKDAAVVAPIVYIHIKSALSSYDYIRAGAIGERMMGRAGWQLATSNCPGVFNSNFLEQETLYRIDIFGNVRVLNKWEYHTGTCARCKASSVMVGPCSICKTCEKEL